MRVATLLSWRVLSSPHTIRKLSPYHSQAVQYDFASFPVKLAQAFCESLRMLSSFKYFGRFASSGKAITLSQAISLTCESPSRIACRITVASFVRKLAHALFASNLKAFQFDMGLFKMMMTFQNVLFQVRKYVLLDYQRDMPL